MSILLCFLLSFAISFLGSIPPGPINTNVLFLAAEHKKKHAWYFTFGGTFPELFLAFFAAYLQSYIVSYPTVYKTISYIFILLLLIMGTAIYFKKMNEGPLQKTEKQVKGLWATFGKGLVLIIFNPLNIPFWLGVFIFFQTIWSNFNTFGMQLSAGFGAFIGALVLNALLIKSLDIKFVKRVMQPSRTLNRVVGLSYYSLALYQLYNIYKS
jgi:threonine/homoserine/homoserine lactone efflux protein